MEILNIIKGRRSTRIFSEAQIKDEELDMIVEAGRYAPSGGNSQTTHFYIIQDKEVLNTLVSKVQEAFQKMEYDENTYPSLINSIKKSKQGNYIFHYNAPTLIVLTNKKGYGNAMADCACALENMTIMASAIEIGNCYINQLHWLEDNILIRDYLETLGISKDETICCSLALGYGKDGSIDHKPLLRKGNDVTII